MQYKLHFVGKGLYPKEIFIKEARKYGVARAMPISVVRTLKDGEPILLAYYETEEKIPRARVFGYFTYEGVNVSGAPKAWTKLKEIADLECVAAGGSGGATVHRRCGSYTIAAICHSRKKLSLCEMVSVLELLAEETGEKVKIFVTGTFHELPEFVIKNIKFTRSIVTVDIPAELPELAELDYVTVFRIEDYEQRKRVPKKAKEVMPLNMFD